MIFLYEKNIEKNITICGTGRESLELFLYCYQLKVHVKQFVSKKIYGMSIFSRDVISYEQWDENNSNNDILLGFPDIEEAKELEDKGYRVFLLEEISYCHHCKEHEYLIDDYEYRDLMKEIRREDVQAEFVMDTLKYRQRLVLTDGKQLRKSSLFDLKKQELKGKQFCCIGSYKEVMVMQEFFQYFGIQAEFFIVEKNVISKIIYEENKEILFYSEINLELCSGLVEEGFELKKNIKKFCTYLMQEIYERNLVLDMDLGYSFLYKQSNYVGMKEYGDYDSAKYKIVTLGNSTTQGSDFEEDESWPYFLYLLAKENYGGGVSVLNAGAAAYNISSELEKFIRDIVFLSPDLVISYSGCINIAQNNIEFPFSSEWKHLLNSLVYVKDNNHLVFGNINQEQKYFGISNTGLTRFQYFLLQAKLLWGAANAIGVNYKCIVQPTIYTKKDLTLKENERLIYYDSIRIRQRSNEFFNELKKSEDSFNWLFSFSDVYDNTENVYTDLYHVNGKGNKIVAERIFNDIVRKELKAKRNDFR